ncbi:MAG: NAD(P)H-binding protein [Terricaulis sp.]
MQTKLALVLGANGGSGAAIAKALMAHGWRVRALVRTPKPELLPGADIVKSDAMNRRDVIAAAEGAALIVHAVNPPGYRNWDKVVVPMIDNTIAAAEASGARIVLPGTVYNFGPETFPMLRENDPQNPRTRKGKIRVALERRLEDAAARGVRTLIVRAGDFFGRHTVNSWFSQGMVQPGKAAKSITYPGKREIGHAWAYLPDFGETVARLADREAELAPFERFHFRGHYFARGVEIAERAGIVANGARGARINGFPWFAVVALSPFVRLFREMSEMRYLWTQDVELDNAKLVAFLGEEPHTPTDQALHEALTAMGCLQAEPPPRRLARSALV